MHVGFPPDAGAEPTHSEISASQPALRLRDAASTHRPCCHDAGDWTVSLAGKKLLGNWVGVVVFQTDRRAWCMVHIDR